MQFVSHGLGNGLSQDSSSGWKNMADVGSAGFWRATTYAEAAAGQRLGREWQEDDARTNWRCSATNGCGYKKIPYHNAWCTACDRHWGQGHQSTGAAKPTSTHNSFQALAQGRQDSPLQPGMQPPWKQLPQAGRGLPVGLPKEGKGKNSEGKGTKSYGSGQHSSSKEEGYNNKPTSEDDNMLVRSKLCWMCKHCVQL